MMQHFKAIRPSILIELTAISMIYFLIESEKVYLVCASYVILLLLWLLNNCVVICSDDDDASCPDMTICIEIYQVVYRLWEVESLQ